MNWFRFVFKTNCCFTSKRGPRSLLNTTPFWCVNGTCHTRKILKSDTYLTHLLFLVRLKERLCSPTHEPVCRLCSAVLRSAPGAPPENGLDFSTKVRLWLIFLEVVDHSEWPHLHFSSIRFTLCPFNLCTRDSTRKLNPRLRVIFSTSSVRPNELVASNYPLHVQSRFINIQNKSLPMSEGFCGVGKFYFNGIAGRYIVAPT